MKAYLALLVTDQIRVIAKKECKSMKDAMDFAYSMPEIGRYELLVYRQEDDAQVARYGIISIFRLA